MKKLSLFPDGDSICHQRCKQRLIIYMTLLHPSGYSSCSAFSLDFWILGFGEFKDDVVVENCCRPIADLQIKISFNIWRIRTLEEYFFGIKYLYLFSFCFRYFAASLLTGKIVDKMRQVHKIILDISILDYNKVLKIFSYNECYIYLSNCHDCSVIWLDIKSTSANTMSFLIIAAPWLNSNTHAMHLICDLMGVFYHYKWIF